LGAGATFHFFLGGRLLRSYRSQVGVFYAGLQVSHALVSNMRVVCKSFRKESVLNKSEHGPICHMTRSDAHSLSPRLLLIADMCSLCQAGKQNDVCPGFRLLA